MENLKKSLLSIIVIILLTIGFTAQNIFATGGYFRHGYGIRYSALGGAGTALSLSSIGAATNPAGLAFIGTRYDINLALFSPHRSFTVTGNPSGYPGTFGLAPGEVTSDKDYFIMPTMGASWSLNQNMVVGIMLYGNGGMNTDYPKQVFGDTSSPGTGINLEQMFFGATYSYKFGNQAVGVTALYAYQRFSAKGLAMFGAMGMSADPADLSGNRLSTSSGLGFKVGYQGKILPFLRVGAAYQMKIKMSKFDQYKGLFAQAGDFDIPANWNIGVAIDVLKDVTLAIDYQKILYSDVKSIADPINPMALPPAFPDGKGGYVPNPNHVPLGADNGSGFGWTDVNVVKLGAMYKGVKNWTFMAGFSVGTDPIKSNEVLFNILAPAVVKTHITFGATYDVNNHNQVSLAFTIVPENSVTGPNRFEAPNQQSIKISMNQFQVELGYAFH